MPHLIRYVEQLFPIEGESSAFHNKIKEQTIEQKRRQSAEQLYCMMSELMGEIFLPVILRQLQTMDYPVYFGEYMGAQSLLNNCLANDKRRTPNA